MSGMTGKTVVYEPGACVTNIADILAPISCFTIERMSDGGTERTNN